LPTSTGPWTSQHLETTSIPVAIGNFDSFL